MRLWPIATPLYETADGLGAGAPAAVEAPPVESESLSDHEASYSPEAQHAPAPDDDTADTPDDTRDERGQFKPRHRATSQRADANDVEAINAQTKRIKDAESRLGADIVKQPGESERVYTLRRRAELLERQSTAQPATATAPTPTATPQPAQRPVPQQQAQRVAPTFPDYAQAIEIPGYEALTYEQWGEQRTRWLYALLRQDERDADEARRAQDAQESQARDIAERTAAHVQRLSAAKTKYPDWDAVVTNSPVKISGVMQHAMLKSDKSDDIQYFLGKNPALAAELNAESLVYSAEAVAPMRRYLDSLVAGQRSTSQPSRTAAGPTGAALARVSPPAPRPPTPVRTGTIAAPDTPPTDDDMSLSAHEKHYLPRRR